MKYFLNISLVVFILVIIFNASQINYSAGLTTDPNDKFFYSGLAAVIGILVVFIVKQLRTLSQPK
ncbi:MAG: hypothetical protein LBP34_06400 [Flavobacteriaceae bacterium]|jgi:hypothetical protein|nr:hypothetical protein [Flavobacteriaceae bacterium]